MIAVCIPAFNLLEYTRWAVESVLRHSAPHPVRLYLLDNGSFGKETVRFMRSVPGAAVARNDRNMWVYAGWNQLLGMAMADAPDIVCLMSNDVQVGRNWLDGIVREMSADRKRYFLPNGNFSNHASFDQDVDRALVSIGPAPRTIPGRAGWLMAFPSEAVPLFAPIPTTLRLWYGDDWIHWKLGTAGYRCETVLDSCAIHFFSKTLEAMDQAEKVRIIAEDKAEFERLKAKGDAP